MSNYSVLKQDINNNIYENQTQQITGTVLNAILNEMTASLGAGYQFAGVATLGMNPGDPDQRVFYLAGEGIYTNFGGIQVPAGKLGVLKWDNRWTLQTIDGLGGGGANLTGYVSVASTDDLPDEGQPTLGYLCGTNLYLYVGEGGDTKEGKYQDCGSFRGPQGDSVQDVEQTQTSLENGGVNKIKFTLSNGISCEFQVRNGTTSSGLFPTVAALQAAYPNPVVGQYAFVGAGFPADIYVCTTAGTWTDSGEDYDGDNVDLTGYATKAEVNQLEAEVDPLAGGSYSPSYVIIDGYYIGTNGTKYAHNGYAYTSPIRLAKGSVITAHCRGDSTTICIISAKTSNPAYPGPLVICDGSEVRDYTYEALDDMEVIICYNKSDGLTVSVTAPVGIKTLAALDDRLTIATEENLSPSFTAGSYVTSSGSVDSSGNFEMSAPIPLAKGDVLIMYARGYNSVVSILSRVNGSGYTPVIIGDNMFSRYVYKCQNDAESVVISCASVQGARIVKISSSDEYRKVLEASSKTFPVVTSVKYTPEHTVEKGKYIDMNGNVISNSSFSITSPVRVNKGDLITVRAKGYLTNVSMISAAQPGGKYAGLVISTDSNVNDYTLVAPWSGEYVACFNTATGLVEFSITPNGSELGRIEDSLADMNATELNLQSTSGQYINSAGVITSQGNYSLTEEFTLNRGDAVLIYAIGYNSEVTILAKVIGVNTYEPLIIGSSAMQEFVYVNTGEAASFRISFRTLSGLRVIKVASAVRAQIIKDLSTEGGLLFSSYVDSFAFAGIPVVGIIGDSLSSGVTYDENNDPHTLFNLAWWQMLKRDSGMDYKYFATGGLTTRSWLTFSGGLQKALEEGNQCCAYVIALGVNDQWSLGPEYLGTPADIDMEDYNNNADTFYGNYGKIIQILTELVPKAKFFLANMPRSGGNYDVFNEAIGVLAGMFSNCYLVDLKGKYYDEFQSGFILAHTFGGGHYSAAAYQVIGKIMERAISEVIADNAIAFRYVQFALDS